MQDSQDYIVQIKDVSKAFPGVLALNRVSLDLKSGEVLALLGENGAGKSTLMKILSGVYTKDSGIIKVFGEEQENLTPKRSQELGIAIIYQELNMCAHLTVAENIFLGRELVKNGILAEAEMNKRAQNILTSLDIDLAPTAVVGSLSVSRQQMVEIAKALSTNARILIMDEPTSALSAKEIEELFKIIRQLRKSGCGIIYISHRLEELHHIVDRALILRDGQRITCVDFKDVELRQIISYMVGREIEEKFPRVECPLGKKVFEVCGLNAGSMVRDVSISLHAGEIVGIAGLMGAGRTETARVIFGAAPKTSGEIYTDGKQVLIACPADAIAAGIVLVPEDRKKDGLCTRHSVKFNLSLPNLSAISYFKEFLSRKKETDLTQTAVNSLKIKLASADTDAGSLSGGNQQKVVVGKWLARNSKVVIFDEPTRGIDVAAKVEIYHIMNRLKQDGIGVLFISSELPEILGISDRIIVMCDGKITGEMPTGEATQDKILELATKFEAKLA